MFLMYTLYPLFPIYKPIHFGCQVWIPGSLAYSKWPWACFHAPTMINSRETPGGSQPFRPLRILFPLLGEVWIKTSTMMLLI